MAELKKVYRKKAVGLETGVETRACWNVWWQWWWWWWWGGVAVRSFVVMADEF